MPEVEGLRFAIALAFPMDQRAEEAPSLTNGGAGAAVVPNPYYRAIRGISITTNRRHEKASVWPDKSAVEHSAPFRNPHLQDAAGFLCH